MDIRVAHVTTASISLRLLLFNQLLSIREAGYRVITVSSPGPEVEKLMEAGIQHIPVKMYRRISPLQDLISLWNLFRVMRREKLTIVHTHNPKPGLLGQLAARLAGVPIVINTLHGFYFHDNMPRCQRRFHIVLETIAGHCSDLILSQNSEDIETAIKEGISPVGKIRFLGNGIDVSRFDPSRVKADVSKKDEIKLPRDKWIVGFVGRLVVEKGILHLLHAAQIVLGQVPSTHFLFIGPIDYEKSDAISPEVAEQFGIAHACTFTGHREDMPDLYALMDVFVLPSQREGFPRAPMEASAMKIPCIVTDIRGCRETVKHGQNGLLVPLGDVDALASAIIQLLSDRKLASQMGEAGRRMALEFFDEQKIFEKIKTEYARLLQERGFLLSNENL